MWRSIKSMLGLETVGHTYVKYEVWLVETEVPGTWRSGRLHRQKDEWKEAANLGILSTGEAKATSIPISLSSSLSTIWPVYWPRPHGSLSV